jgi:hypothetical protein
MKVLFKLMICICLLLVSQACNEILENTNPSTAVSQEVALTNPDAVQAIRARVYNRFHVSPDLTTTWLLGPSALVDDTNIRPGRDRFEGFNSNDFRVGVGTAAYNNLYDVINDANILINGIEEGVLVDELQTQFRGEGLFMRAFALHHLVRIFSYEPGMAPSSGDGAGFDLGVIIRTEPTLDVSGADFRSRSSVGEVYTQILSDIDAALTDLNTASDSGPFNITPAAAQALLARVQLYQGNYAEADAAATAAVSASGARLAAPDEVASMFDENSENPEAIFTIDVNSTTETGGVNDGIAAYTSTQWMAQIPTQDLIEQHEESDARLAAWYTPCINDVTGSDPGGCTSVNADGLELHKYASEQGNFADDYVHLRVSEMVLIQAEARLNTDSPAAAVAKLNELRAQRGIAPYAGSVDNEAVLDAILEERRLELVAEGHRFFDLKRLGRDLRKAEYDSDTGEVSISFVPYESSSLLDDLPQEEVDLNDMLMQNPFFR